MGELIGRFHPLIVHLPIGILILAFLMELFSRRNKFRSLKTALPFILQVAIASSLLACFTGWIMPKEGEFDERLIGLHFWISVAMTCSTILVYLFYKSKNTKVKKLYFPTFIITIILLTLTGHFGGSLTHGEEFLTAPLKNENKPAIQDVNLSLVYPDIIQPILKSKCYSCHNEGKRKGGLIMSSIEGLIKGGDEGTVIIEGNSENSSLIQRVHLTLEDEKHMPPKGKKQLTKNEISLLEWWISNGPAFDKKVGDIEKTEEIEGILEGYEKSENEIDLKKLKLVSDGDINKLKAAGIGVNRQSKDSPLLSINLSRDNNLTSRKFNRLKKIADNIYELDLSYSNADNKLLTGLKNFKNLQILKLQKTQINSDAIKHIEKLNHLTNLNLYQTAVDDKCLQSLSKIKSLKTLYIWQSKITENAKQKFSAEHPLVNIQGGIDKNIFGDAQLKAPIIQVDKPIFDDTTRVALSLNFKNVAVYYTLDGSTPDSTSLKYESPFLIKQTSIVKAISLKEGWTTSEVNEKTITKIGHKIASIKLDQAPNPKYKSNGANSLIDFDQGSLVFSDNSWLGYEGQNVKATLDLGAIKTINNVIVGALEDTGSYIFFPKSISVRSSKDGKKFESKKLIEIPMATESSLSKYKSFLLQMESHEARFLEVKIFGTLKNPEWHSAPGAKNWFFVDEIMVN